MAYGPAASPGLPPQAPGRINRHGVADSLEDMQVLDVVAISIGAGEVQTLGPGQLQQQPQFILSPGVQPGDLAGKAAILPVQFGGDEPVRPQLFLEGLQQHRQGTR